MFWPLELPIVVTSVLMTAFFFAACRLIRRYPASGTKILLWTLLICFFGYVPSCMGIMVYVIDPLRFGVLKYRNYGSLHSRYVRHYLPEAAEDIIANVQADGFEARFRISRKGLVEWKADLWKQDGDDYARANSMTDEGFEGENLMERFRDKPLEPTEHLAVFQGPRARNGGGATIYYDEARGIAYEETGYW